MSRTWFLAVATALTVFATETGQVALTGKVIDATTKKPITDFHLILESNSPAGSGATLYDRNVHNGRGSFTVLAPPGVLSLTIEAAGHLPAMQNVSGGGNVVVSLRHGVNLRGRVLGPDGKPLDHVDVSADFLSSPAGRVREIHASTDAKGNFLFVAEPGERTIRFSREGLLSEERRVTAKDPATTIPEVQLSPAASVAGSVVDDLGAPLARARVRATLQTPAREMRDGMTDEQGKFTIQPLRPGKYVLEGTIASHVSRKIENIDVPNASPIQIRLDRGAIVRGFVRGSTDGERPYVSVYLGPTAMTLINLKEEFGMTAVPAGRIPVYAEVMQPGTARRTNTITIETTNGGSTSVELSLPSTPVVTGTVTQQQGSPRQMVVRFVDPNAPAFPPPLSVLTDENGTFRVVGLQPGTYNVETNGPVVVSPKTVTIGIASTPLSIEVKPQS